MGRDAMLEYIIWLTRCNMMRFQFLPVDSIGGEPNHT